MIVMMMMMSVCVRLNKCDVACGSAGPARDVMPVARRRYHNDGRVSRLR